MTRPSAPAADQQRLFHEQQGWLGRHSAGDADVLALAVRELQGARLAHARVELDDLPQLAGAGVDSLTRPAQ